MVTMWEAKASDGRGDELLAWLRASVPAGTALYRGDGRLVAIGPAPLGLPDPPPGLLARPAHAWDFEPV